MKKTFLVYIVGLLVGAVGVSSICSCSIYHNTKRDQLIAVSDASGGSCTSQITIFDMNTFR